MASANIISGNNEIRFEIFCDNEDDIASAHETLNRIYEQYLLNVNEIVGVHSDELLELYNGGWGTGGQMSKDMIQANIKAVRLAFVSMDEIRLEFNVGDLFEGSGTYIRFKSSGIKAEVGIIA